jgi:DNA-binding response OmpR family regulator
LHLSKEDAGVEGSHDEASPEVAAADTWLRPTTRHAVQRGTQTRDPAAAHHRDCDEGSPPMRVLVVEDFEVLARSIGTGLRREGIAVDVVLDGTDALHHLAATRYAVVILDRDLPGIHGDDVCRRIVADRCGVRVLMLTAADTVNDRVDGLGLGADDYLPKPFAFAELVARVRALARRSAPPVPPTLTYGDISVDPARRAASRAGKRLELSAKEFALLECLLASPGLVLSAEELLERVWDEFADPFTSAVKHTMHRLRAKLGDPPVIHTVREGGYCIGDPE